MYGSAQRCIARAIRSGVAVRWSGRRAERSREANEMVIGTILLFILVLFFSSRRRHTRYIGDWSSDVCSSDLLRPRCGYGTAQRRPARRALRDRSLGWGAVAAAGEGRHDRRSEERRVGKER